MLDTLQRCSCKGWESSQERVAWEMTITWTGSCVASLVRKDRILRMLWCWGYRTVCRPGLHPGSTESMKAILWCPWWWLTGPCEGSLSPGWRGVQFWVWGDVQLSKQRRLQTFRDACCNMGVGGGWGEREEQLGVVCISVVRVHVMWAEWSSV